MKPKTPKTKKMMAPLQAPMMDMPMNSEELLQTVLNSKTPKLKKPKAAKVKKAPKVKKAKK